MALVASNATPSSSTSNAASFWSHKRVKRTPILEDSPAHLIQSFNGPTVARRHPRPIANASIKGIAASDDGSLLVVVTKLTVQLWDRVRQIKLKEYSVWEADFGAETVNSVVLCNHDRKVLVATNQAFLVEIDLDKDTVQSHRLHSECLSIAMAKEAEVGIYGLITGELCLFHSADPGRPLFSRQTGKPVACCTITKTGTVGMTCSSEKFVRIWGFTWVESPTNIQLLFEAFHHPKMWPWGCGISESGEYAITSLGVRGNVVHFWDLRNNIHIPTKSLQGLQTEERFDRFAASRDARFCFMACKKLLRVWDIHEDVVFTAATFAVEIGDLSIADDLSLCVCGLVDGSIHVVDVFFAYRMKLLLFREKLPVDVLRRVKYFVM